MKKGMILSAALLAAAVFGMTGCSSAGKESAEQAEEAFLAGDYENAVTLYNQALTQDSHCADYYVGKGLSLCASGQYEEALESFEGALSIDPASAGAFRGEGIAHLAEKEYSEAQAAFTRALELVKSSDADTISDLTGYRAEAEYLNQEYDAAFADYSTLLDQGYETVPIHFRIGQIYLYEQQTTKAMREFQLIINDDYRNFENYLIMSSYLEQAGCEEESATVVSAALSVAPENAEEYYWHGLLYLKQDEVKKAFSCFEQSYNMGYVDAGYYLGYCYEVWEQYSDAELVYEKQLTQTPSDARLYSQLAVCKMRQGDYNSALILISQGLSLGDSSVEKDLLWNEGVCYENLREYDAAREAFARYQAANPSDEDCETELAYLQNR